MLIYGTDIDALKLAMRHHVPRQLFRGIPATIEHLFLFQIPLSVAFLTGMLTLSLTNLVCTAPALGFVCLFLFRLFLWAQRGQRPSDPALAKAHLDWLVLRERGELLDVSGMSSPVRVLRRCIPMAGLTAEITEVGADRFRLDLIPEGEERLDLMDLYCTNEEAKTLLTTLHERIRRFDALRGEGNQEIPRALQELTTRPSPVKL